MRATLICIPTLNEVENITPLLTEIRACQPETSVVVVDDNSLDGTAQKVREFQEKDKNIFLIERPIKQGLGSADRTAFEFGLKHGFQVIVQMDGDCSHSPRELAPMLALSETYDFVIGSRYVTGGGTLNWGLLRRLLSAAGNSYARLCLNGAIRDFTSGFNIWNKHVLEAISVGNTLGDGYEFLIEMKYLALRQGFVYKEHPILFKDRVNSKSKLSSAIVCEAIWRVPMLPWSKLRNR